MGNEDINLTYETLFELLRREKNRVELQQLEPSFYNDFIEYLKTKKELLQEKQNSSKLDQGDLTKLMIQIDNINRIMKELYDRREKKIVTSALFNIKSNQSLSKDALLENEIVFYNELSLLLKKFRSGVLLNILDQKQPEIKETSTTNISINNTETPANKTEDQKKDTILLRIQAFVPKFVGEQLEAYGPFEADEITTLPLKMANILITNGKAEEINGD